MKLKFRITPIMPDFTKINAMFSRNGGQSLISLFIKLTRVIKGARLSANNVRLIILLLTRFHKIYQAQGIPGLVKVLKAATVLIQQCVGGYKIKDLRPIGARISRTKSGLPRLIPSSIRKEIRNGNVFIIRFVLTITNLYRVLDYKGKLDISTIVDPGKECSQIVARLATYLPHFRIQFFKIWDNKIGTHALKRPDIFPLMTSSPNTEQLSYSSSPQAMIASRFAFYNNPGIYQALTKFSLLLPTSKSLEMAWDKTTEVLKNVLGNMILEGYPDSTITGTRSKILGKIGTKYEAAGKVRLFAMVDCFTQWLLNPLHKYLFSILKKHPMDGTFNQHAPLKRAPWGKGKTFYSFDLSAATDRLPVILQVKILESIFGRAFAQLWMKLLVGRTYHLRVSPRRTLPVKYSVGQPMGALSSWAMLAITHHFIVQCAYWFNNSPINKGLFTDYALLGDDIVIWHPTVAANYLYIMNKLGVKIGLAKSIISTDGQALEFAKRTFFKGTDVSPVPIKEFLSANETTFAFIAFCNKYQLSDITIQRLLGMGYRSANPLRWRIFQLMRIIPTTYDKFMSILKNPNPLYLGATVYKREALWRSLATVIIEFRSDISRQIESVSSFISAPSVPKGSILDILGLKTAFYDYPKIYQELWSIVNLTPVKKSLGIYYSAHEHCNTLLMNLEHALKGKPVYQISSWKKALFVQETFADVQMHLSMLTHSVKPIFEWMEAVSANSVGPSVNPKAIPSKSPFDRNILLTARLWKKWSKLVTTSTPDLTQVRPAKSFNDLYQVPYRENNLLGILLRPFLVATSHVARRVTPSVFVRKWGFISRSFGFRTLFWFLVGEVLGSALLWSIILWLFKISVILIPYIWEKETLWGLLPLIMGTIPDALVVQGILVKSHLDIFIASIQTTTQGSSQLWSWYFFFPGLTGLVMYWDWTALTTAVIPRLLDIQHWYDPIFVGGAASFYYILLPILELPLWAVGNLFDITIILLDGYFGIENVALNNYYIRDTMIGRAVRSTYYSTWSAISDLGQLLTGNPSNRGIPSVAWARDFEAADGPMEQAATFNTFLPDEINPIYHRPVHLPLRDRHTDLFREEYLEMNTPVNPHRLTEALNHLTTPAGNVSSVLLHAYHNPTIVAPGSLTETARALSVIASPAVTDIPFGPVTIDQWLTTQEDYVLVDFFPGNESFLTRLRMYWIMHPAASILFPMMISFGSHAMANYIYYS